MAVPFLRELILGAVFAVAFTWHMIHAARRDSSLAWALAVISSGFAGYMILNVNQVELWLGAVTGQRALSSLLKNLVYAWVALGCLLAWRSLGVAAGRRRIARAVVAVYAAESVWAWVQLHATCNEDEGLLFDKCALTYPLGTTTEILGLVLVSAAGIATAWLVRPLLGWRDREHRSATLLVAAVVVSVIWALVAAAGVAEIYNSGELSGFQYVVRTPLAACAAGLVFAALLYPPISQGWTYAIFAVRCRGIARTLGVQRGAPTMAGAAPGHTVTDIMDALGQYLEDRGIAVDQTSGLTGELALAEVLRGTQAESVEVPSKGTNDLQRRWLLRVASVMQHDRNQGRPRPQ